MLGISAAGQPGRKFFDRLVHARWSRPERCETWTPPHGHYLGAEPVFVPHPADPRAGVLICQVFDALTPASRFALFDARNIAVGPVASMTLQQPIHLGFHTSFQPFATAVNEPHQR
jgi:carotenoid cleavage dioxygenase-like enzyme